MSNPVFKQFSNITIAGDNPKEQWRNMAHGDYVTLHTKFKEQGMLALAIQNGLISPSETPLQQAYDSFLTVDSKMLEVKRRAGILAARWEPVLITGESGTGKELIAKILHGNRTGRFVAVNITAMVDTLFESELFGHEKGSFTGAHNMRIGKIELADRGTLFIDEVGDLSLPLQAKLLRVLQEGVYQRVGGNEDIRATCRFIFATHCELNSMVESKMFRLDLYHRIKILSLHLTSLRQRHCDVPALAKLYGIPTDKLETFMQQINIDTLAGNCRELQAMILRYNLFGSVE